LFVIQQNRLAEGLADITCFRDVFAFGGRKQSKGEVLREK